MEDNGFEEDNEYDDIMKDEGEFENVSESESSEDEDDDENDDIMKDEGEFENESGSESSEVEDDDDFEMINSHSRTTNKIEDVSQTNEEESELELTGKLKFRNLFKEYSKIKRSEIRFVKFLRKEEKYKKIRMWRSRKGMRDDGFLKWRAGEK